MDIKLKKYVFIGFFILTLTSMITFRLPTIANKHEYERPCSSAITIVDKVYTFLAPEDTLSFTDMALKKDYMYYMYVEIVTPHICELNITILDPQNRRYDIFSSNLAFTPEGYERAEIPFGTALSGNYTFQFHVLLNFNLNIYIRIEEGDYCLRDKIPTGDWSKMIFYRVTQFNNGMYIEHNIQFNSDTSYKFYFGRVSPIATTESNKVYIYSNITDPNSIKFEIYSNYTLASVSEIQGFSFGTSAGGIYTLQLQISNDVEYINLGYAIIEDYMISEEDDNNQTGTPSNSTQYESGIFSVPPELLTILTIIAISIVSLIAVFVYQRNQKRSAAINFSQY
jgi:hypothetical protein